MKNKVKLFLLSLFIISCNGNSNITQKESLDQSTINNINDSVTIVNVDQKPNMNNVKKLAGKYFVYDNYGISSEIFELSSNLNARWSYKGMSKIGDWTLKNDIIEISILGNTGMIVESYKKSGNKWIDLANTGRYIKKM